MAHHHPSLLVVWTFQGLRKVASYERNQCCHLSGNVVRRLQGRWQRFMPRGQWRTADARKERPMVLDWWVPVIAMILFISCPIDILCRLIEQVSSLLATRVRPEASQASTIECRSPSTGSPTWATCNSRRLRCEKTTTKWLRIMRKKEDPWDRDTLNEQFSCSSCCPDHVGGDYLVIILLFNEANDCECFECF